MKRIYYIYTSTLLIALCASPLVFLPSVQEFYDSGKWYLLAVVAIGLAIAWSVQTIKTSEVSISHLRAFMGFAAISIAASISVIFSSQNKIEAILSPFGPVTFILLSIILITASHTTPRVRSRIRWGLSISTAILAVISIYQFFGLGKTMFPSVPFLADPQFSPTGSLVSTLIVFFSILPLMISQTLESYKEKYEVHSALLTVCIIIILFAVGFTGIQYVTTLQTHQLPFSETWSIFINVIRNPTYMFTGIGVENFLLAFNTGKSLLYNISPLWNIRFTISSSMFMYLGTVYGIAGLIASAAFLYSILQLHKVNGWTMAHRIVLAIAFLCTPPSVVFFILCALFFLVDDTSHHQSYTMKIPSYLLIKVFIALFVGGLSIGSVYGIYRIIRSEQIFYSSLLSAQANNGTQTYNQQMTAISQNQYIGRFHIIYSQTNLALALSLVAAINKPDNTSSDEQKTKDRQLVAQLISQSIREAKLATSLNANNVLAWENLARIYNQLIGTAQGADTWTITSYKKAIELDPKNPILRLELGSIAMKQKAYDEAIAQFKQAVMLKKNYANAYYNLANAYKVNGNTAEAIEALQQTQRYTMNGSTDYEKVSQEIEALTAK